MFELKTPMSNVLGLEVHETLFVFLCIMTGDASCAPARACVRACVPEFPDSVDAHGAGMRARRENTSLGPVHFPRGLTN